MRCTRSTLRRCIGARRNGWTGVPVPVSNCWRVIALVLACGGSPPAVAVPSKILLSDAEDYSCLMRSAPVGLLRLTADQDHLLPPEGRKRDRHAPGSRAVLRCFGGKDEPATRS